MTQLSFTGVTTILSAVTSTGAGSAFATPPQWRTHADGITWETTITGSPSTVSVKLQGSLDNSVWHDLDSQVSTSGQLHHSGRPVPIFVRANVVTLSGGSTPTVTVDVQQG